MNKLLRELEYWNQEYPFDYNCFDVSNSFLLTLTLRLKTLGILVPIVDAHKFYMKGHIYKMNNIDLFMDCKNILKIPYSDLPNEFKKLNISTINTQHWKNNNAIIFEPS